MGGTVTSTGDHATVRQEAVPLAERIALSVEEAGMLLGISRDLTYDLVARGDLPSVKLGRRLVVPRRSLEAALLSMANGRSSRYRQELWMDFFGSGVLPDFSFG